MYLFVIPLLYLLLNPSYYHLVPILSLSFFLMPRHSRELGFLAFALLLSSPYIRSQLNIFKSLELSVFMILLVIILSLHFSGSRFKTAFLWTISGILTGLLSPTLSIVVFLIPSIILVFPVSPLSYLYGFVATIIIIILTEMGIYEFPSLNLPSNNFYLSAILPMILIAYSLATEKLNIVKKRQTSVLIMLFLFSFPFLGNYEVEGLLLLSLIGIRLISSFPNYDILEVKEGKMVA